MTIYFDENFPPQLAEALNILDDKNNVFTTINRYQGFSDEKLITEISKNNAILITRDKKMKKFKGERELLIKYKMVVMFYEGSHSKYWDIVRLFIKNWEKITKELSNNKQFPNFFKINVNGKIEKLEI